MVSALLLGMILGAALYLWYKFAPASVPDFLQEAAQAEEKLVSDAKSAESAFAADVSKHNADPNTPAVKG